MARLFIVLTTIFLLVLLVRELRKYFTRDKKEQELHKTYIEGDVVDIEFEIAEEKLRQKEVRSEMDELKKENTNK